MTTLQGAAEYIVENAESGKEDELICRNVLQYALGMFVTIKANSIFQTNGYLYQKYITGGEKFPEYTEWAVKWLFDQTEFPTELPLSWNGNPIMDQTVFLPDMMAGLKKAAEKYIEDRCGEMS